MKHLTILLSLAIGILVLSNSTLYARYYDARTGRFLQVDPKARKYPSWSPYVYAVDNPLLFLDPDGKSSIKYNKVDKQLVLYSSKGEKIGEWNASNLGTSKSTGVLKKGGLEIGTYDFMDRSTSHKHGDKVDAKGVKLDSKNGAFGEYGIFRLDNFVDSKGVEHKGVGVHSGRADAGGWEAKTEGCIRTTDEAMNTITNTTQGDPLETLEVTDPRIDSPIVVPSEKMKEQLTPTSDLRAIA